MPDGGVCSTGALLVGVNVSIISVLILFPRGLAAV